MSGEKERKEEFRINVEKMNISVKGVKSVPHVGCEQSQMAGVARAVFARAMPALQRLFE